jgi:hypothetical protein
VAVSAALAVTATNMDDDVDLDSALTSTAAKRYVDV